MKGVEIPDQKRLYAEIRENNCRELLACEVDIQVAENRKTSDPSQLKALDEVIKARKLRIQGLVEAIEIIDRRVRDL